MMSPAHRFTVREIIALGVISAFLIAFFIDPTAEMRGALIAAFTGSIAYYLGSSKGAHENREALNRMAEHAGHAPGSVTVEAPATVSVQTSEPAP